MAVLLVKVLGGFSMKQTIKVAAPSFKFDDFLKTHFRENEEMMVHDPEEKGKQGDWVLIRKLPQPLSLQVKHQLIKVVYPNGEMVDPVTGRKCIGTDFVDDIDYDSKLFGWKPFLDRNNPS